jgi:hypothetical protein
MCFTNGNLVKGKSTELRMLTIAHHLWFRHQPSVLFIVALRCTDFSKTEKPKETLPSVGITEPDNPVTQVVRTIFGPIMTHYSSFKLLLQYIIIIIIIRVFTQFRWSNEWRFCYVINTAGEPIGASEYLVIRTILPYLIEQCLSWEANRFSANQETTRILWEPKFRYRVDNSPPPVHVLSHTNQVYAPLPTSWKTILILSSQLRLGLPIDFISLLSPPKPCMHLYSSSTCYMPIPPYILESGLYLVPYSLDDWRAAVI